MAKFASATWAGTAKGSPPTTWIIAATPSLMPWLKLPALNLGRITWLMITQDCASVSTPSRP
ncbi:hypothetical protein PFLmoz3_02953 [Pseudomonas fluorescens]|uniref:Uncharacterized protein n=1 Tax=Pseudomonas fluorescens TaxID=294 RepID=A0A109LFZ7_PSEFL|nr:hypothetical protein PFLmoz3_02953 [Pseudomonas fluorescens]